MLDFLENAKNAKNKFDRVLFCPEAFLVGILVNIYGIYIYIYIELMDVMYPFVCVWR